MAIVVIGGNSRNIGKTSAVCALISALRERHWTAIKITQFDDEAGSTHGKSHDEAAHNTAGIFEEHDASANTDSSRYLAAGAVRSLWVRTHQGQLAEAMPAIRAEIARAENVIIESNSVLGFLNPDVYVSVLDPEVEDFKLSALRYLDRADAVLLPAKTIADAVWKGSSLKSIAQIPRFEIAPPDYSSSEFVAFIVRKLEQKIVSR